MRNPRYALRHSTHHAIVSYTKPSSILPLSTIPRRMGHFVKPSKPSTAVVTSQNGLQKGTKCHMLNCALMLNNCPHLPSFPDVLNMLSIWQTSISWLTSQKLPLSRPRPQSGSLIQAFPIIASMGIPLMLSWLFGLLRSKSKHLANA
jgi:hypothetical protein